MFDTYSTSLSTDQTINLNNLVYVNSYLSPTSTVNKIFRKNLTSLISECIVWFDLITTNQFVLSAIYSTVYATIGAQKVLCMKFSRIMLIHMRNLNSSKHVEFVCFLEACCYSYLKLISFKTLIDKFRGQLT